MDKPLLSVLVLSYNNGDYIYDTLSSIMAQDYSNIEVLVGDDASADFNKEEVETYLKERSRENITSVSIKINEENKKTCANLEGLLSTARGEYVTIIAADDTYYSSNVLSALMKEFERDSTLDVVMGHTVMYDSEDLIGEGRVFSSDEVVALVNTGDAHKLFAALAGSIFLPAMGVIFRRDVFPQIGLLSNLYSYVEDWPIQLRCARLGMKMHFHSIMAGKHRGGGISTSENPRLSKEFNAEMIRIMEKEVFPYINEFSSTELSMAEERLQKLRAAYQRYALLSQKEERNLLQDETRDSENNQETFDKRLSIISCDRKEYPLYTIILLHYRQEIFYKQALASVFSQNYPNIELIFADDATPELDKKDIQDYVEENKPCNIQHVAYLWQAENRGTVSTLKKAIDLAHGKYLQFFAADDVLAAPFIVKLLADTFEKLPLDHKVLASKTAMMDFGLRKLLWSRPTPDQEMRVSTLGNPHEMFQLTCTSCVFGISSMVFRTSLFSEYAYLDEGKNKLIEDWPIVLRLSRRGEPIDYLPVTTLLHRDGGISNKLTRGQSPLQRMFAEEHLKTIEQDVLPYLPQLPMREQLIAYTAYQNDSRKYRATFGKRKALSKWKLLRKNRPLTVRLFKNYLIEKYSVWDKNARNGMQAALWLGAASLLGSMLFKQTWPVTWLLVLAFVLFTGAFVLQVMSRIIAVRTKKR